MESMSDRPQIVVGITGASGAAYATRLVECLAAADVDTHVIISPHGRQLLWDELRLKDPSPQVLAPKRPERVHLYPHQDVGCRLASGSFQTAGMVVCPCSSNTLAEIAGGMASNLITRAAHVHLKESRRLIVAPREMPVSRIELENQLRLSTAGAIICPASPGFYMLPKRVGDLVDFVVGKLLDLLSVPHRLNTRWAESPAAPPDGSVGVAMEDSSRA